MSKISKVRFWKVKLINWKQKVKPTKRRFKIWRKSNKNKWMRNKQISLTCKRCWNGSTISEVYFARSLKVLSYRWKLLNWSTWPLSLLNTKRVHKSKRARRYRSTTTATFHQPSTYQLMWHLHAKHLQVVVVNKLKATPLAAIRIFMIHLIWTWCSKMIKWFIISHKKLWAIKLLNLLICKDRISWIRWISLWM